MFCFELLSQDKQSGGPYNFLVSSSLMRGCRNLNALSFECCDWIACVASESWGELPVPPAEVIARGTQGVFQFVRAALRGGLVSSRSCRVMVVGPQMVRAHARIGHCVLTAAAGWQDQPDQRAEGRPVSAHRPRTSNSVGASQPTAVGGWGRTAHMGLCRCSARCCCDAAVLTRGCGCRAGGLLPVALRAFHSALPLHPDVDASPTRGTRRRPVAPPNARATAG